MDEKEPFTYLPLLSPLLKCIQWNDAQFFL